jgi:hypothetical protein
MTSASPVSASAGSASRVLARLLLGSEGEPAELSTKRPPSTHYSYGEGEPARAREMAFEEGLEVRAMYSALEVQSGCQRKGNGHSQSLQS